MKKSTFQNNGNYSIIVVKYGSQLHLSNCNFEGNYGLYGACLYSDNSVKVVIRNCLFNNNRAGAGGTMFYVGNKGKNRSQDTSLTVCKRKQTNPNSQAYSLCENYEIEINHFVINCSFQGNVAGKGGAIYTQHTSVLISESHFVNNFALYGGALMAWDVTLIFQECKSVYNMAAFGGVLMVRESSSVCIGNSKFNKPSALPSGLVGSYIYIEANTTVTLYNNTFHSFKIVPVGSQILSRGNNTLCVHNCSFVDNHQIPGFTVNLKIEDRSKLKATLCSFTTAVGFATIAFWATGNSHATFKDCTFKKISGIGLYDKASAFVYDSIISNCISTLHGVSLVFMGNDCKLTISNTSITDNVLLPSHNFLIVPSNALIVFINVVYARNSMSTHILGRSGGSIFIKDCNFHENAIVGSEHQVLSKGLMATVQNDIKIYRTLFINNSVNIPETHLFSISNGRLLVDNCIFKGNFPDTFVVNRMALFTVHNVQKCVFHRSNFEDNTFYYALLGLSNLRLMKNSFKVEKCDFLIILM